MGFDGLLAGADTLVRAQLGRTITYTPTAGAPLIVNGVFDAAYVHVDEGMDGVTTFHPAVFLGLSDIAPNDPLTDNGATVTVESTVYTVWDVRKDGMGGVVLFLHLA